MTVMGPTTVLQSHLHTAAMTQHISSAKMKVGLFLHVLICLLYGILKFNIDSQPSYIVGFQINRQC